MYESSVEERGQEEKAILRQDWETPTCGCLAVTRILTCLLNHLSVVRE